MNCTAILPNVPQCEQIIYYKDHLTLSVKEPWFSLMQKGEKTFEVRKASKWIKSRLYGKYGVGKHYRYITIINGYGDHRPRFTAIYNGFGYGYKKEYTFTDGSILKVNPEDFVLNIGSIIERKNIKIKK